MVWSLNQHKCSPFHDIFHDMSIICLDNSPNLSIFYHIFQGSFASPSLSQRPTRRKGRTGNRLGRRGREGRKGMAWRWWKYSHIFSTFDSPSCTGPACEQDLLFLRDFSLLQWTQRSQRKSYLNTWVGDRPAWCLKCLPFIFLASPLAGFQNLKTLDGNSNRKE